MPRLTSGAALVTGASSGIGRATARALIAAGYPAVATARHPAALADLAAAGCQTLALDVTDEDAMAQAVRAVEEAHGGVAVLINNAGYGEIGPLEEAPIAAHGASGLVALAVGCLALRPPEQGVPALFRVYLAALWLMALSLVAVVALDWGMLATVVRIAFGALVAFALFIGWMGWRAWQHLRRRRTGWHGTYIEDVGFTLIALFDGFVIIGALDLGAPVWLIVAIGILGVLVGRGAISRTKTRGAA